MLNLARLPHDGIDLEELLRDLELSLIDQAMARANGNKAHAARLLGLKRTTLVERLKRQRAERAAHLQAASTASVEELREAADAAATEEVETLEPEDLNDTNDWETTP